MFRREEETSTKPSDVPDGYLGESSTFDFMSKLRTEQSSVPDGDQSMPRRFNIITAPPSQINGVVVNLEDPRLLPERSIADQLVDAYFLYSHPIYPFLHAPSFRVWYAKLWDVKTAHIASSRDNEWRGILNLVFAFGCEYVAPGGGGSSNSRYKRSHFFARAKSLILKRVFGSVSSLELVQALLLLSHYLQSTLELNNCWAVVGMAIRMGQTIGLHLAPSRFTKSVIEAEMRTRVFWGLFVIDRVLSMKLGRPPSIHDDASIKVGLPLEVNDENITEEGVRISEMPSLLSFFIQTIAQVRILDKILREFYEYGSAKNPSELSQFLANSITLDFELVSWQNNLPYHLQPKSEVSEWQFQRQRNVLLMRFFNARIILHRQAFLLYARSSIDDASQRSLLIAFVTACISSARETVQQVHEHYSRRLLHSWWYNSHYVFTAMGILLCFRSMDEDKRRSVLGGDKDEEVTLRWGIEFLEEVEQQIHSVAARYVKSLLQLQRELGVTVSRSRGESALRAISYPGSPTSGVVESELSDRLPNANDYTLEEILGGYSFPIDFFIEDPLMDMKDY